jgi:hypothetical protein
MGDEFSDPAGGFDDVESLGELHPDAIDLHIEQGGVGRRDVVVERIIHKNRTK